MSNSEVASQLKTTGVTVGFWRNRFIKGGVEALGDEPRPGAPRKVTDDTVDAVVRETLESNPRGATHWSTRGMAQKMGLSQSTVSRIWRAFGLKPHRTETFQLSTDPLFVEKVRDVAGLYMAPPTNALVLCVDEKSQIQALNRTQPLLPMRPGQSERHTPEYKRHGTTSLFAALDIATGNVIGQCFRRHRSLEFKKFLEVVDAQIPVHFTPTHASWMNQVERWFGLLSERQIKRGSHLSVRQLESAISEFIEAHNEEPRPFAWTKSADDILAGVSRFATATLRAHSRISKEISDSGD